MQQSTAIWITSAFHTLPTLRIKAITGLISIHFHLNKISRKQQLRTASLPLNHTIMSLLGNQHSKKTKPQQLPLNNLTSKQHIKINSAVVDSNNCLNSIFPSFDSFHKELSSGFHLVDNFSNCFSFHIVNCKDENIKNAHTCKLNKIFEDFCWDSKTVIIISDVNIKNSVATSILHIYSGSNIQAKTIHYTINITSTKAELFTIRYGINQAVQVQDVTYIIVITNAIHSTRRIFESLPHSYQL